MTRLRHRECLEIAVDEIDRYLVARNQPIEIASEYLRRASANIDRITGKTDVEDLLDIIFSEFCLGK